MILPYKYVFRVFIRMLLHSLFLFMDADEAAANLALANGKVPPTWSVERDKVYPLRKYIQDLELWSLATDVPENRRGPVVVLRLTGAARDLMRDMPGDMLANGFDVVDNFGQLIEHRTGVQCVVRALRERFGALEQEVQIFNVSELMTFQRQSGETTDQCIARFNSVMFRATDAGGIQPFGPTIRAWIILTHLRLPRSVWPTLLTATMGMLPATELEYAAMIAHVRRNAHLHEHSGDRMKSIQQPYFTQPDSSTFPTWPAEPYPQSTNEWNYPEPAYPAYSSNPSEDDLMSWQSFSSANSDPSEELNWDDVNDVPPGPPLNEHLYVAYRFAKRRFRAVGFKRRRYKGSFRKGGKGGKGGKNSKGHGKGKSGKPHYNPVTGFWTDEPEPAEVVVTYFKGGKGGKGGRSGNPLDKNGKQMECSLCGSIEHFWRKCPKGQGKGKNTIGAGKGQTKLGLHHFEWSVPVSSSSAPSNASTFTGFALTNPEPSNAAELSRSAHTRITFMDGSAPVIVLPERSSESTAQSSAFNGSVHYAWWPAELPDLDSSSQEICSYHSKVRLSSGEALVVDTGAVNGLAGSVWVDRVSKAAAQHGRGTQRETLAREHSVGGVGQSNSVCKESATIPVCMEDGVPGTYKCLVVPESEIPGLLPFDSMEKRRVLLDTYNGLFIEVGAAGYDIKLSSGSRVLQMSKAPTGHPMLSVSAWNKCQPNASSQAYSQY